MQAVLSHDSPMIGKPLSDPMFSDLYDATPVGIRVSKQEKSVFQRQMTGLHSPLPAPDGDVRVAIISDTDINPVVAPAEEKADDVNIDAVILKVCYFASMICARSPYSCLYTCQCASGDVKY